MQATVSWKNDLRFSCETDTGHSLELDANDSALTPMESVLLSVGACSSIDVVDIVKKARQDITGCVCELKAERAETAPKFFTAIHAHYIVTGQELSEKHIARAVQLSAEKYCSVMLMLTGKVDITTSYELLAEPA